MRGRHEYAEASRSMIGKMRITGTPEVQEVEVFGDYAYCWNHLAITITPVESGTRCVGRAIFCRSSAASRMAGGCCFAMRIC
jgi:ketosteroid isomerase-like protein